jgi:hypothetical protein
MRVCVWYFISAPDTGVADAQRSDFALAELGRRVSRRDSDERKVWRSGRKVRALRLAV